MMFPFKSPIDLRHWLIIAVQVLAVGSAVAQQEGASAVDKTDPQQVLAYQGDVVLTQQGIDAAFSRIPDEHRLLFIRDGGKVDQLVRSLLEAKVVAADARAAGFAEDPLVQKRIELAVEKELAEAWIAEIARRAPEADYQAMAYEDYLANPERYSTGVLLDVSHILIDTEERTQAEAKAVAEELKRRLEEDPSRFDALVMEYSDDPAKSQNQGRYERMRKGYMARPFEKAAYALEEPGQISDPVKTDYGYHLIRLDARYEPVVRRWDKVRDEAVARVRDKHLNAYKTRYLQKLMMDPIGFPKGSVEVMARRHFGDDLEKAAAFGDSADNAATEDSATDDSATD